MFACVHVDCSRIIKTHTHTTMVSIFNEITQLECDVSLLQFGSIEEPCEIIFGIQSDGLYAGNRWQNLSVQLPAAQMALMASYDRQSARSPLVRTHGDLQFVTVKIDSHTDGLPVRISSLVRGESCRIIVCPKMWSMDGRTGVSLKVQNLQLTDRKKRVCEFI